jgi:hypothetical protein
MSDIKYNLLYPNIELDKFIKNMHLYSCPNPYSQININRDLNGHRHSISHIDKTKLSNTVDSFIKNNILALAALINIMSEYNNVDIVSAINQYSNTLDIGVKHKNATFSVIYSHIKSDDFVNIISNIDPNYSYLSNDIFNDFFRFFHSDHSTKYRLDFKTLFDSHIIYYTHILDTLISKINFLKDLYYTNINNFKIHGLDISDVDCFYRILDNIINLNKSNIDIDSIMSNNLITNNYIKKYDYNIVFLKHYADKMYDKYFHYVELSSNIYDDMSVELNIKIDNTILRTIQHINKLVQHINNPTYNLIKLYQQYFSDKTKFYYDHLILSSSIKHIIANTYVLTYSDNINTLLSEIILFYIYKIYIIRTQNNH